MLYRMDLRYLGCSYCDVFVRGHVMQHFVALVECEKNRLSLVFFQP